ncbi:hypothetical protein [Dongshaea marina]|uniref:hypothetical protein n=1 Tax=Dongshaea marina TaxID=2047966 RepID=UPI00131F07BD|nr:hypothetical protein [Dongshaea marina]
MRKYNQALLLLLLASSYTVKAGADDLSTCPRGVDVLYHERVPYMEKRADGIVGLVATPAAKAFSSLDIKVYWKEVPPKRQLLRVKSNESCTCALGWFKNSQREVFAKYSSPIYRDKPQVALIKSSNSRFSDGTQLKDTLLNHDLKLLMRDGYSYGSYIDKLIDKTRPAIKKVSYDNLKMLELIYYRRYDYFFISPEEIKTLIKHSSFQVNDFKSISFSDIPSGENRYIICSQKVPDKLMKELDESLVHNKH